MPLHPDFQHVRDEMIKKHGKEKGTKIFYKWVNKNSYDDTKPLDKQKNASSFDDWDDWTEDDLEELLKDEFDFKAKAGSCLIHIPAYKMPYVATPATSDKDGPINVKAITLEEIENVNGWRVVPEEFEKVAEQYTAGRQLRLNHSKDVQEIIGKSFISKSLFGRDVAAFMGKELQGINPNGKYVVTEFEADPRDPQVRTNILRGYVDTGSIGLDANAWCDECGKPLQAEGEEMVRTCHHLEAGVKLTDVEVKEYSYVSEPAYPHSFILPSFAAAVSNLPKPRGESSLSKSPINVSQEMSATTVDPTKIALAAKAEGEGKKGEADADALAIYKMGYADALKFAEAMAEKFKAKAKADDSPDEKKEETATVEAKASKTDQVGKVAQTASPSPAQIARDELMSRVLRPTEHYAKADPAIVELFTAAVKHPDAPPEIKARYKGVFQ